MIDKFDHYSLTNPASVYDEEAMTALELAGRTAKKVNECIDEVNQIPEGIEKGIQTHIKNGDFARDIDQYAGDISKRVDNLLTNTPNEPTTMDLEVIDLRLGADGKTYNDAGAAVRTQFRDKVSKVDFYPLDYETGSVGLTKSGWDYSDTFAQNTRIRIKEGKQLQLSPGDVIGLTDYSGARFYLGFRVGDTYTFEPWRQSDYTVQTDCECVILVAHEPEASANKPEDPHILGDLLFVRKMESTANRANNANANIQNALDVDLMMVLGGMNLTQGVYGTRSRYVTRDIVKLGFDIALKHSDACRMAVYTYSDANGNNAQDKGWVTDNGDYIIKSGTYFRIMVMADSYDAEANLDINPARQFDSDLYKAIRIEPVGGKGINLMNTSRTLGRVASFKALTLHKRAVCPRKVKAVNHRGYNYEATENTVSAFKLSKKNGFDFVECDVRFSSDGVPVLFHDDTVDRISNGTGRVHTKTLAELQALDLGGEKIATFDEFVKLCASLQLHPYIEIEPNGDVLITPAQVKTLVDIVNKYGMAQNVTWISFRIEDLQRVTAIDPFARVGYIVNAGDTDVTKKLQHLASVQTGLNEAFIDSAWQNPALNTYAVKCAEMFVPLEVWTYNAQSDDDVAVLRDNPYISGVTSDKDDLGKLLIAYLGGEKEEEEPKMGSFTIHDIPFMSGTSDTSFEFTIGQSWRQFIQSNTYPVNGCGFSIYESVVSCDADYPEDWSTSGVIYEDENFEFPVDPEDLIFEGHTYYFS